MSVEQTIQQKLTVQFSPLLLKIENESHMHSSDRGAESHFKVVLVSENFVNQRVISRHRAVYSCLAYELENGVHALALHLFTAEEWAEANGLVPKSPNCAGVGQ
ncbi:BolA/IbaG family iron-sulfur metabolism protein [Actinobacillus vicugnae]|uniref:BolA/IbaG family iron-sulfur metabolism protein n=1 Tax=Actinobacillus vicugnae TaxID=2573093 RepID=UPI0012430B11|nr:BolA/IbaG family iron-sulfur metabolism protein [Actinobacillus vicugnae]